jgi:hypothetical protein
MTKILIEDALIKVIANNRLHRITLKNGVKNQRKKRFVRPMASLLPNCIDHVSVYNKYKKRKCIDLVSFQTPSITENPIVLDDSDFDIKWALMAKHYSPHQDKDLQVYLKESLTGPLLDILNLIDCGFKKLYILQLQTEITSFYIHPPNDYNALLQTFPFIGYLGKTESEARTNLANSARQNRIFELKIFSRKILDNNLICNSITNHVVGSVAEVNVAIHYLISGPFSYTDILPRLADVYNFTQTFANQFEKQRRMPNWNVDVSIASDPNA